VAVSDRSTPDLNSSLDAEFTPELIAAVASYDEHLRHGDHRTTPLPASSDTSQVEVALLDCIQFLERAWPRSMDAAAPDPPQRIGKFEIERVIGQGGFGVVYLAHDTLLGRTVALKVPRLRSLISRSLQERFQREARAAAALDHPHIVPVFEAGEENGVCYLASAYCPGASLAQWLREHTDGLSPRTAARLVACLADAVACSHSHGILHRDIKPGNVMLVPHRVGAADSGDPSLEGLPFSPRLGDFGLAKFYQEVADSEGARDESAGTAVLGTPAYMAPEQLSGGGKQIGPGADVYALGVVLYEVLVGRPPFQGPSFVDVLDQIRSADPVPVHRLRRDVPRDLETICLKCLAKSAAQRYATADELRDDLQRFLDGRPILARPPGRLEIAVKWIRRQPAIAALVASVAVFVTAVAGLEAWNASQLQTANDELQSALQQVTDEKARAVASEHEARGIAYALDMQSASRARDQGDFLEFSRTINRYRDGMPLAPFRGREWYLLERYTRTERRTLFTLNSPTYDILFGPQGQAAVVGEDAQVRIIDLRSGAVTTSWPTGQVEVNSACFMPDGKSLWTAGDDGTVRCWDIASHTQIQRIDAHTPAKVFKVRYSTALNLLVTCGTEGPIRLWDLNQNGASAGVLAGHTDWVQDAVLAKGGRQVISVSDDRSVRVWDLDSRAETWKYETERWKFRDVALSPNGRYFAACNDRLRIFSLDPIELLLEIEVLDEARLAAFNSDGRQLYVSDRQGIVHVYNLMYDEVDRIAGAVEIGLWRAHDTALYSLRASPADQSVFTAGKDGRVEQWSSIGEPPPKVVVTQSNAQAFGFDPQGRWLAIGGKTMLALYDVLHLEQPPVVVAPHGNWTALAFDGAGHTLAAGSSTGEVHIWNLDDLTSRVLMDGKTTVDPEDSSNGEAIAALSFSRDNTVLAVAAQGTDVLILDPRTGAVRQRIKVGMADAAKLSPTEDLLATTTADHRVELWHWPNTRRLWQSEKYADRPGWVVFSPDGRLVLAETGDRTVRLFDRSTGEIVRELGQHRDSIMRMAMSPDGRTIATKDSAGRLNFWHAGSGQLLYSLPSTRTGGYQEVVFSPDGDWLAFRSATDEVQLVPLHP